MRNPCAPAVVLTLLLVLALGATAAAQPVLVPAGPEVKVNQFMGWQQEWPKVAIDRDGTRFAIAYNSVVGNDIYVRFYDIDGTPTSDELFVNVGVSTNNQDEPMIAMDLDGNVLVTWSDRNNHDGGNPLLANMGCFGRVYDPTGTPLGLPFIVNETVNNSQWEPHPNPLPGGGWAVTWNGDQDGNAYLRLFDVDGTPRDGEILYNTYLNNGQTEAEHAVLPDGTIFTVYADFGGNVQFGSGTNLLGRRYNLNGNPLDALEFVINDSTLDFNQLEPRMHASGLGFGQGRFVLVWEDYGNDGDGAGIFARVYDQTGTALGTEFQVNETTVGDQLLPEVVMDHVGNFIAVWEDWSTGFGRIAARHYDPDGVPHGSEFFVDDNQPGIYRRPSVAMDQSGEEIIFAYSGPGDGIQSNYEDVYFKRYTFAPLTAVGAPQINTPFDLQLELPGGDGLYYFVLASFGTAPGLLWPDGRLMQLDVDLLFWHSLFNPNTGLPFVGFQGFLGPLGTATATMNVPQNTTIIGLPIHFGVLTLDITQPALLFQLRHITKPTTVILQG